MYNQVCTEYKKTLNTWNYYLSDLPSKISNTPCLRLIIPDPRILPEKSRIKRTQLPVPLL